MKTLKCATFCGELKLVEVESSFARGLPGFDIVGLADTTIKESILRVKSALNFIGFNFPAKKITINLSPSDFKKTGSHFDLSIALLILLQHLENIEPIFVFGELGLDGSVKSTANLFSILLFLSTKVKKAKILLPKDIANKAAMIPNLEIYAINSIQDAIKFFEDKQNEQEFKYTKTHKIFENFIEINGEKFIPNFDFSMDFSDIKGQGRAKTACLIAASGMHNVLFEGSPGCGKSMCAKRLRYILPPQSLDEILLSCAYSSLNNEDVEFSTLRSFRNPHHSSTRSSIFGGGSNRAKIGEVALANGGELFFDEFPHFSKQVLESLREPLEDNQILVSRVNSKVKYDTKFVFVAAQNPCPCGNYLSKDKICSCLPLDIKRYKSRISGPLLDRIDIYVLMDEISKNDKSDISSKEMYEKVILAFKKQKMRGQKELNGKMSDEDIKRFCILENDAKNMLDMAISRYQLSHRGINKILKTSRTIADLKEQEIIKKDDILESMSYKMVNEI
ncbi:putative Mg chelatase-like protein [Campylobacter sputorum subsp. bubulus]|uniref:Putative Mg chelatase-like protein n=1 Tax=Campylobacter sputorum subsp. sputorum TaxID=32024 RepID=A0A381DKW1_9BACT|nr:YifB family Mg chelatase-like AAA ATPase [Campylobacter sputorum]ASM34526.1 Mg chelatase-related protein [Campylobacter sputorum aubsp. sputorum RM3237]ASM37916.1 Mg chelatase-related protein [Campylobacter sputorum bv. paraureolyticus LMG 11764]KAB0580749.1 YifB family Mg chelatase-like AAA ATPase [Campylobacter sputorum subsp. sputorum]MDY6120979.1 YifB family Mg chelatase-like AAA ATPase [Campylobacter sputorum]QEL04716.1 magnesium chelatase-related protein [Campylobacter sputorum subsp.